MQKPGKAAAQRRRLQQLINDPVLVAFGPFPRAAAADGSTAPLQGRFSALSRSLKGLPPNVHLLTTKVLEDGRLLLRLAHLFQVQAMRVLWSRESVSWCVSTAGANRKLFGHGVLIVQYLILPNSLSAFATSHMMSLNFHPS